MFDVGINNDRFIDNIVIFFFLFIDVVVYVEVRFINDNRSKVICRELVQFGVVVVKIFIDDVIYVVFKEGSKRIINKVIKKGVYLVSVLWVDRLEFRDLWFINLVIQMYW